MTQVEGIWDNYFKLQVYVKRTIAASLAEKQTKQSDQKQLDAHLRRTMKSSVFAFLLLAVTIATINGKIINKSILERFAPECRSELRIVVKGVGENILETEARLLCKESCAAGVEEFKLNQCPELCGQSPIPEMAFRRSPKRPQVCNLCVPNSDRNIRRCRRRVDFAVLQCQRGCRRNREDLVKYFVVVHSTSRRVRLKFRSKITK